MGHPTLLQVDNAPGCAGTGAAQDQDDAPALWLGALNMTSDSSWDGIELLPYNSQAEALALHHLKVRAPGSCPRL